MSRFDYDPADIRPALTTTRDEWHELHRLAYDTRGNGVRVEKEMLQHLLKDQAALIYYHRGQVKDVPNDNG